MENQVASFFQKYVNNLKDAKSIKSDSHMSDYVDTFSKWKRLK